MYIKLCRKTTNKSLKYREETMEILMCQSNATRAIKIWASLAPFWGDQRICIKQLPGVDAQIPLTGTSQST